MGEEEAALPEPLLYMQGCPIGFKAAIVTASDATHSVFRKTTGRDQDQQYPNNSPAAFNVECSSESELRVDFDNNSVPVGWMGGGGGATCAALIFFLLQDSHQSKPVGVLQTQLVARKQLTLFVETSPRGQIRFPTKPCLNR